MPWIRGKNAHLFRANKRKDTLNTRKKSRDVWDRDNMMMRLFELAGKGVEPVAAGRGRGTRGA